MNKAPGFLSPSPSGVKDDDEFSHQPYLKWKTGQKKKKKDVNQKIADQIRDDLKNQRITTCSEMIAKYIGYRKALEIDKAFKKRTFYNFLARYNLPSFKEHCAKLKHTQKSVSDSEEDENYLKKDKVILSNSTRKEDHENSTLASTENMLETSLAPSVFEQLLLEEEGGTNNESKDIIIQY
jgi:uncharacterized protein YozE (UPF0346 family)